MGHKDAALCMGESDEILSITLMLLIDVVYI